MFFTNANHGNGAEFKMKSIRVKYIAQMVGAFLSAFFLVNILCYFYSNVAKSITNPNRYTTTKSKTQRYVFYGQEGYGITTTDKNGFYNDGNVLPNDANVICIGSSHTEAIQINTSQNYVSQLNKLNPAYNAYNLGVSGQSRTKTLYRLPYIPVHFPVCKVIINETPSLPTLNEWDDIIHLLETNDAPIDNQDWKDGNILFRLYRAMPYAGLLFSQFQTLHIINTKSSNINNTRSPSKESNDMEQYRKKANYAMGLLRNHLKDTPLIIVYLPKYSIEKDGSIFATNDIEQKEILQEVCESHQIVFVHEQIKTAWFRNYESNRRLPYGFQNSHVGQGHLNAEGHRMLAEVLHKILQEEGFGQ